MRACICMRMHTAGVYYWCVSGANLLSSRHAQGLPTRCLGGG